MTTNPLWELLRCPACGWGVVMPYRALARFAPTRAFAEKLPLKSYAEYPVRVIVNDQFDRFSARAGLTNPLILGGAGWRAVGERPLSAPRPRGSDPAPAPTTA